VFHPDSIRADPFIPPVVFTRLERPGTQGAGREQATVVDLAARQHVTLSYEDRVFSLDFAALSYRAPEKNRYAYKLDGVTGPWIDLGTEHRLTFTGLSPGAYTLRVRGSNSDGVWNEAGATLRMTITPPWWRTAWAYTVYVLLALAALYGARRYELNRSRLKNRLAVEHATAEKLRELDQVKSRFFANLSHEFRTPLTLIVGPLQRLLETGSRGTPDELATQHRMMLRNARRLQRLINQILDLSRLEAGHMTLHARAQDLNAFVLAVVRAMTPLAERERVTLTGPAPSLCVVAFDAEHMEKVLGNLLSNALKFTPAGGRVDVTMEQAGTVVEIAVRDTGIGLSAEQVPHVFDRFYQADASSTRRYEGTGIGLALVKELVELHGGTVQAESVVGLGSTFRVLLPLGEAVRAPGMAPPPRIEDDDVYPAAHPAEESDALEGQPSGDGALRETTTDGPTAREDDEPQPDRTTVLIVDDNADVRAYLRSLLEPTYRVHDAGDGVEGLERARALLPDLIIADVMMPRLDGFGLSRALKEDPMLAGVPVILLTARAGVEDEVEGLETGADQYVRKPFEPSVLLAQVENLLAQRERLRNYFRQEAGLVEKPEAPSSSSPFEARLHECIEAHLDDSLFSVEMLADEMALSPSQLRRRMKEELHQTPNELIRHLRLQRAATLLREGAGTISEIAFAAGFNSLHYFSRTYRAHFGISPSEHLRQGSDY